ncbi:MAG: RimK/LysX family protein [Candidatus Diapherotrites archaeon]
MVEKKKALHGSLNGKNVLGLVEIVQIIGLKRTVEAKALIDSGASRSSVDMRIAAKAGLGPIVSTSRVKCRSESKGWTRRPIVKGELVLHGLRKKARFALADRSEMACPVLIGRDIIHPDFVIDVGKSHESRKIKDEKKPT